MATKIPDEVQSMPGNWQAQQGDEYVSCSVGIMAYNEEANISCTIRAILEQQGLSVSIDEVIVVASGCTDRTVPIVAEMAPPVPGRKTMLARGGHHDHSGNRRNWLPGQRPYD